METQYESVKSDKIKLYTHFKCNETELLDAKNDKDTAEKQLQECQALLA